MEASDSTRILGTMSHDLHLGRFRRRSQDTVRPRLWRGASNAHSLSTWGVGHRPEFFRVGLREHYELDALLGWMCWASAARFAA
jgi:hypothetical protein